MSNRTTTSNTTTTQHGNQLAHDKIAMRAYEKWCKRGRPQGTDKLDWMEAEAELRAEVGRTPGQTTQPTQTQAQQPRQQTQARR